MKTNKAPCGRWWLKDFASLDNFYYDQKTALLQLLARCTIIITKANIAHCRGNVGYYELLCLFATFNKVFDLLMLLIIMVFVKISFYKRMRKEC